MAKILLTGGGTAGHVTANLALLGELREKHTIYYMGSKDGIEKELAEKAGLPYFGISTGKLRRYFSLLFKGGLCCGTGDFRGGKPRNPHYLP